MFSKLVRQSIAINSMYSVGLDAEFIIRDKKTGLPVSMVGKIGGDKKNPLKVPRGALQEDGVLAEINIHPVKSFFDFERNFSTVIRHLEEKVNPLGCYIDFNSIEAEYPDEELNCEQAWRSGCDSDFNAWSGEKNEIMEFMDNRRTCGGHIHLGIKNINRASPNLRRLYAQFLDLNVGTILLTEEPKNNRRKLYGMPGAYRPKPYGIELRTPSNYWLKNRKYRMWAWRTLARSLANELSAETNFEKYFPTVLNAYAGVFKEIDKKLTYPYFIESYTDRLKRRAGGESSDKERYWREFLETQLAGKGTAEGVIPQGVMSGVRYGVDAATTTLSSTSAVPGSWRIR